MGNRNRGGRSRDGRDRRQSLAKWSSAAAFGDETIDRPTTLTGRRSSAADSDERAPQEPESPTPRNRSDTGGGWATITPIDDEPDTGRFDDERDAEPSGERRRASRDDDDRDDRYSRDEPQRGYADTDRSPEPRRAYGLEAVRADRAERARRAGRTEQFWPEEPEPPRARRARADAPRATDEQRPEQEPRPSRRSQEEAPRRSRRAVEEAERRAVEGEQFRRPRADDEPPRSRRAFDDDEPPRSRRAFDDEEPRPIRRLDDGPRRSRRAAEDDDLPPRRRALDDEQPRGRRALDDDEPPPIRRFDDGPRRGRRAAEDDDLPRRLRSVDDDEPRSLRGFDDIVPRSRRARDDEEPRARRAFDEEPRARRARDDDEPRGRRRLDDEPYRSRRAATSDDVPRRVRPVGDDAEPRSRRSRPDADASSWRTRETMEIDPRRPDSGSWREDPLGSGGLIDLGTATTSSASASTGGSNSFNGFVARNLPRAIESSESAKATPAPPADPSALDTWRGENGTWRTRNTAETGSWRMPPPENDARDDTDTEEWRSNAPVETGSWSRSRGQWVPTSDDTGEQPNFTVRRFDDTGEISKELVQAIKSGRVLDHDDLFGTGRRDNNARREQDRRDFDDRSGYDRTDDLSGDRRVGRRRRIEDEDDERPTGRRYADRTDRANRYDRDDRDDRDERGYRDDRDDRDGGWADRTAEWPTPGPRPPRRSLPSRSDERDDYRDGRGYRDDRREGRDDRRDGYGESRSRYPRYDDEPRYNGTGRRGAVEPPRGMSGSRSGAAYRSAPETRSARHASGGYDDEPRPARRALTAYAGPRRGESVITPRSAPPPRGGTRGELVRLSRRPQADDEDDDEDEREVAYGYASAGFASVAWFGLPLGAFLLWAILLGGTARADCVDAGGRPCPAPRDAAFSTFGAHLPQVGVAIVLSVIVALLIRLVSPYWKPATVGFAASVVGAGVTTVVFTVINGGSP